MASRAMTYVREGLKRLYVAVAEGRGRGRGGGAARAQRGGLASVRGEALPSVCASRQDGGQGGARATKPLRIAAPARTAPVARAACDALTNEAEGSSPNQPLFGVGDASTLVCPPQARAPGRSVPPAWLADIITRNLCPANLPRARVLHARGRSSVLVLPHRTTSNWWAFEDGKIGGALFRLPFATKVGEDAAGNKYYEKTEGVQYGRDRFVIYNGVEKVRVAATRTLTWARPGAARERCMAEQAHRLL